MTDADYYENGAPAPAQVELGRLLFFDKILSGNQNISCASCHHPRLAGADGIALPLGEGPKGLGPDRRTGHLMAEGVHGRVPRNTQRCSMSAPRSLPECFTTAGWRWMYTATTRGDS